MVETNLQDVKMITTVKQEYKILAEYKMVESEKTGGVYVIPSYENSLLWFGVIFIRKGFYKGGVFRFNISLPDNFPDNETPPTVIFQTEVFHPQICPFTGTLDVDTAFPKWRFKDDHIWQLLKYISHIFIEVAECLKFVEKPSNKNAYDLATANIDEFKSKIRECVQKSLSEVYNPAPVNDPHYIAFETFNEEVHRSVLNNMKTDGPKCVISSAPTTTSLSWVKEGEFKALTKE